jgi:hypothetical protein
MQSRSQVPTDRWIWIWSHRCIHPATSACASCASPHLIRILETGLHGIGTFEIAPLTALSMLSSGEMSIVSNVPAHQQFVLQKLGLAIVSLRARMACSNASHFALELPGAILLQCRDTSSISPPLFQTEPLFLSSQGCAFSGSPPNTRLSSLHASA